MEHNIEALKLKLESSVCVVSINYHTTHSVRAHSEMQNINLLGGLGHATPEIQFHAIFIANSFV